MLCIRGFLAARKHADRIMLLVEMMAGSAFPCYRAGSKTAQALRRRFALHLTEAQARQLPAHDSRLLHFAWQLMSPPVVCTGLVRTSHICCIYVSLPSAAGHCVPIT